MQDYYHNNSQDYFDKTIAIDPSGFLSTFVRYLPPRATILDAGCGSGRDLLWLKKKGFDPLGFERSPGLAALAGKKSGCPVIQGDFTGYDFSALAVDAVLLSGALVHLGREELAPVFQNVLKALNPGGHVYLSLKQGRGNSVAPDGREFTLWDDDELRSVFAELGLQVKDFSTNTSAMETGEIWLAYVLWLSANDETAPLNF